MKSTPAVGNTSSTETTRGKSGVGSAGMPIRVTAKKGAPSPKSSIMTTSSATAKTSAPKRKAKVVSPREPDLQKMIREQAYFRSERRGFVVGFELQDWFEAEEEVYRMMKLDLPKH